MKRLIERLKITPIVDRDSRWVEMEQQRRTQLRRRAQIERALKKKARK